MSQEPKNEMVALTAHTEKLVNTLTAAVLATAEVAADRIELAAGVAQIQQRMAALGSVLECVSAQKQELLVRLDQVTGPMRSLLEHQVAALVTQEQAILAKAGVPQPAPQLPRASTDSGGNAPGYGQDTPRRGGNRPRLTNGTRKNGTNKG